MRNRTLQKKVAEKYSYKNRRGAAGCGLIIPLVMGAIFATVGFCLMYFWGWPVLQKAKASTEWPSTKGVVNSSEVIRKRSDDGVTYKPEVIFDYKVDGEEYQQSNVCYNGDVSTSNSSYAHKTVKKYKVGTEVDVYYDPENPEEAVLEPGTTWGSYFPIGFGAIFFTVGSLMFLGTGGYLLFGIAVAGGAASGMIGKSPGSTSHRDTDDENPYANTDNWEENDWENRHDHDDGFENL